MNNTASFETADEARFNEEKSHALHYGWVFWFMHRSPGEKITNYEGAMKKIATFNTVNSCITLVSLGIDFCCLKIEEFWAVYSHLRRPSELPNISDYHLFKEGVRPVWEVNIEGISECACVIELNCRTM